MERELAWDDEISKEGSDFVILPEGNYNFTVESYERARHNGSTKIPPCPKAIVKIRICSAHGDTTVTCNLFLHQRMEWKLSEFFTSIGLKKPGEPLQMNWNQVPGTTGRLSLYIDTYIGEKDGKEHQINKVKEFYPKETGNRFQAGKF